MTVRRILLVTNRDPRPRRRGDQLRAVQFARTLASRHRVDLLAPGVGEAATADLGIPGVRLLDYRRTAYDRWLGVARSAFGRRPLQAGLYDSSDLRRRLSVESEKYDAVILQLARSSSYASAIAGTPVLVDFIDCLSLGFDRRSRFDGRLKRPFLHAEARRLRQAERALGHLAQASCVVCERDRAALARVFANGAGGDRAAGRDAVSPFVAPLVVEPTVLDREEAPPKARILITGNLGYWVNADAVSWFVRRVWPTLSREHGDLDLVIAGSRPSAALRRLVRRAGAELLEDPPDLLGIIARSAVSIAPMRGGSGVPVKVLESWSVGTPVVASAWAAAGVSATDAQELLVAESVAEWRSRISALLERPEVGAGLAERARVKLRRENSESALEIALDRWLDRARPDGTGGTRQKPL